MLHCTSGSTAASLVGKHFLLIHGLLLDGPDTIEIANCMAFLELPAQDGHDIAEEVTGMLDWMFCVRGRSNVPGLGYAAAGINSKLL